MDEKRVYVAGTYDTKGRELTYIRDLIVAEGLQVVTVDLSTRPGGFGADIGAVEVAACHPGGVAAVFTGERGTAVAAMTVAFERFIEGRTDVSGLIGVGGSGNTALVTQAMRALPVGVPKVMVSTVASANVAPYVGASDIMMMYSVTDIAGLNRISRVILANAARAMAGMARGKLPPVENELPAIGLTMFGVTTPCVTRVAELLANEYDPLIFHATGTGGQSMEKLADSHLLAGIIDVTTTEVADLLVGGIFPCSDDRFGAIARTCLPYVGSCGALDMVNFGPIASVPAQFRDRRLHSHNPQVTLMRTTPEENEQIGHWIGERLNRCNGPVVFVIPEGGVSMIDVPEQPFYDPVADAALFAALEKTVRQTANRRLVRVPFAINDSAFADVLVACFRDVVNRS